MTIPGIVTSGTQVDPAFWLNAANQAIRSYCGWHVAPVITETLVLDGKGGRVLLLPSKKVVALISVLNDGVDVTGKVKFSHRTGVLTLQSGWSCDVGSIEIELQHGHAVADVADVAALIVTLTKRAAASGLVVAQAIGPASQKLATSKEGAVLGVPLLESEKAVLAPHVLNWGV